MPAQKRKCPQIKTLRGVRPVGKKWRAFIKQDGKFKHIGLFANIGDAVKARDAAAKAAFGERAQLNWPDGTPKSGSSTSIIVAPERPERKTKARRSRASTSSSGPPAISYEEWQQWNRELSNGGGVKKSEPGNGVPVS